MIATTGAWAQNTPARIAQHQGDTTKVSINNYYGDNPTKAGAANTVTRERMNKGMITNSLDSLSGYNDKKKRHIMIFFNRNRQN